MIIEELLDLAEDDLKGRKAIDVRIGLSYAGVLLDDQSLGLAYSFRRESSERCEVVDRAGDLEGSAWKLAKFSLSPKTVESSVGVAAINAVINRETDGKVGDILDFLDVRRGDKVGMIGDFKPLVERLEEDIELYVFERYSQEGDVYPDWAAERILPNVDVAIITGSAVINKTVDHLLKLAENARETVILGPSTPMAPKIFKSRRATLLGGVAIHDPERALKILSQGGGRRKIATVSKKISLVLGGKAASKTS